MAKALKASAALLNPEPCCALCDACGGRLQDVLSQDCKAFLNAIIHCGRCTNAFDRPLYAKPCTVCTGQGGVLYVKPVQASHVMHKPWFKGGVLGSTTTCKVSVAGQSKHTITGHGPDPLFTEALEFLLGAVLHCYLDAPMAWQRGMLCHALSPNSQVACIYDSCLHISECRRVLCRVAHFIRCAGESPTEQTILRFCAKPAVNRPCSRHCLAPQVPVHPSSTAHVISDD